MVVDCFSGMLHDKSDIERISDRASERHLHTWRRSTLFCFEIIEELKVGKKMLDSWVIQD